MTADPRDPEPAEHGREVRVFGPPGTGKTTWLSGSIRNTVLRRQTSRVVVASFTTTAAAEIGQRGLPLRRDQVGTLHSLAYRSIGHPEVAAGRVVEWNKRHPGLAVTPPKDVRGRSLDEPAEEWSGSTDGDVLLSRLDNLRARMVPPDAWPPQVAAFGRKWAEWKRAEGVVDFTDMIEVALRDTEEAPGSPVVGFFDEVQDFTALELALVRRWGERMERVVLAGDDDQCVYGFKGATPDAFLDPPVPDRDKYVLDRSYRVPGAVHAAAQAWVERLTRREPKTYLPRTEDPADPASPVVPGLVRGCPHRWQDPQQLSREVAALADAGRTVMVLATCAYMVDPLKHQLRRDGVPFHNPYRRTRGDWNPLRAQRGVSSVERLLSYLVLDEREPPLGLGDRARPWTGDDVRRWSAALRTSALTRGARALVDQLPDGELGFDQVAALFADEAELEQAVVPELEWFARNLLAGSRPGMEYPLAVARRRGPAALAEPPRVVIGTVHSVKGGQADVVYLFPDLSQRGYLEWAGRPEQRDSVVRQVYVGMTRAREELVVCAQSSHLAVPPERVLAGARRAA